MKFWLYSLIALLFTSCFDKNSETGIKKIEIQKYFFDFPTSYKKVKQKTFNSYVGKISNDTVVFDFHFSDHVRPPIKTTSQFFDDEEWKPKVLLDIATKKNIPDFKNVTFSTPRKAANLDSVVGAGCDYIVSCKFDSLEFEMPIFLPDKMKRIKISIDTIFGQYRETYIPDDPKTGITGVFIKTITRNRRDSLQRDALSLTTTNLTENQQIEVLKILSTFRLKEND